MPYHYIGTNTKFQQKIFLIICTMLALSSLSSYEFSFTIYLNPMCLYTAYLNPFCSLKAPGRGTVLESKVQNIRSQFTRRKDFAAILYSAVMRIKYDLSIRASMATRTRNQVISFRVTPAEKKQVSAKTKRSGLSQQEYLLDATLHHPI